MWLFVFYSFGDELLATQKFCFDWVNEKIRVAASFLY
jgi:hypothetical protein